MILWTLLTCHNVSNACLDKLRHGLWWFWGLQTCFHGRDKALYTSMIFPVKVSSRMEFCILILMDLWHFWAKLKTWKLLVYESSISSLNFSLIGVIEHELWHFWWNWSFLAWLFCTAYLRLVETVFEEMSFMKNVNDLMT